MKIYIIAVGKVKSNIFIKEMNEYIKQLPYKLEIIEVKDEPTINKMNLEKDRIIKKIPKNSYIISLDIKGKGFDSISFSNHMKKVIDETNKDIVFIIGGSFGLSEEILNMSNLRLSFSMFTFPHQLMRLILVEQIYRAFKIMENHPYHK